MKPGIDEKRVLSLTLTPDDHGAFREVPFYVPPGTERVSVQCEVEGYGRAGEVVDLGLRDPAQIRGWSGGARSELWVEEEKATPGYLPGEIHPGEWAVIVSSNRIPPEGCRVKLVAACTPEKYRWLKGDLHSHSVHSDGAYALAEAWRLIEAAGLDFAAVTDHNTSSQNLAYPRESPVVHIPGVELTTYRGHCSLLGVAEPLTDFRVTTREELDRCLSEARRRGAVAGINHPFKECVGPGCQWEWGWDVEHDWIEVWNGPWQQWNDDALDLWQRQLAAGRRVVGMGGSDTHRPHEPRRHGEPTIWVWSRSRSRRAILEAIVKGHLFISCTPEGPIVDMRCGLYMMGDEVPGDHGEAHHPDEMRLAVQGLGEGDVLRIISERGLEQETHITGQSRTMNLAWPVERRFYRAEVWRFFQEEDRVLMAAMSNPIYFGPV